MALETYKGQIFDSREEVWMAMWLEELKLEGYVKAWEKVTKPFQILDPIKFLYTKVTKLKTKEKTEIKNFTLLNDLTYTPDFIITWTDKGWNKFVSLIEGNINPKSWFYGSYESEVKRITYVEVKPTFDQNGKTAKFSVLQKIIWAIKRIFVDLIITENLFEGTFMPQEAMPEFKYKKKPTGKNKGTKGPGDWKVNYIPKTLNEFLNGYRSI
jgi:hypothetical protein